jgi:hypothetical protein
MSQQLDPQTPTPVPTPQAPSAATTSTDTFLSRAKEGVAAILGLIIILCFVVMIWKAFGLMANAENQEKGFQQVKDLLLFINPLVGVVIGYYFTKVSTEARAESAEATAKVASTTAQQATEARLSAETKVGHAEADAEQVRAKLNEIIPAAEAVLTNAPVTSESAVGNGSAATLGAHLDLQRALERARSVV